MKHSKKKETWLLCSDSGLETVPSSAAARPAALNANEHSRMQLITVHPDVPCAAAAIITSNCHLLIHTGLRIGFIYYC